MLNNQYYSLTKILKKKATYNVIFGERSNGKTYAVLTHGVKNFFKNKSQIAYVRRWKEDVTGRRAQSVFRGLNEDGSIEKLSKGEFSHVHYVAGKFYLANYGEDGKTIYSDSDLLGYTFAISDGEHDKSTSYPNVTTVMFDEFLTNKLYLNEEFVAFMNTVSTIVRRRNDVSIFMLGNTVNKYCPYFSEMGLNNILKMEQGEIDVYRYGNSKLTVAVEYCSSMEASKTNNHYFAFDNPKLDMITSGAWELAIYPHLPIKYKPKDVLLIFFIVFSEEIYQCEVVSKDEHNFIFIHHKTTPLKENGNDLVYSFDYIPKMNYNSNIMKPMNSIQERITWYFKHKLVCYQNNTIGDAISNYLKICGKVG